MRPVFYHRSVRRVKKGAITTMARSPAGSGTIRRKTVTANGKEYVYYEGRYTAGYNPGTGRQVQKSITGKTQKEVARKLKEATAAIERGQQLPTEKLTVAEWLEIWKDTYLGGVKPYTRTSYLAIIKNHLVPGLGAARLDRLDSHTIQVFINGLDLSPKTVKNIHGVLHAALRQAVLLRYVPHNAADGTQLPRIERKELHVLDEDAAAAFLRAVEGHKFGLLYQVVLFTGLREGEALGLTWDRVDFDRGTVLIDRQLHKERRGAYYLAAPKNDKPRTISPPPFVLELLRIQKRRQAELRIRAGDLWQDTGLVFTNETGGNLTASAVYKQFKQVAASIGLPGLRVHDLRHSYAVAALRSGDDVKTLQGNLGHHTAAFTLDQYGHVTEQMKKASAERMEAYIQGVLKG